MAGFTESALEKKLADLNNSQQSIQTLSLWLIHHRKHHTNIVKVWHKELLKAVKEHRKLTFMYLANDVIQNSKKKGPEFGKEFSQILRKTFEHLGHVMNDEKMISSIQRLVNVWEERGIYDAKLLAEYRKAFAAGISRKSDGIARKPEAEEPPAKKIRHEKVKEEKSKSKSEKEKPSKTRRKERKSDNEVEIEVGGTKEVHVTLSPHEQARDPPEPEELIKALQDLEHSASGDAAIRERIASFPPEVSEIHLLSKIEDKAVGDNLAIQVREAVELLTNYNQRLTKEMEERKAITRMLQDFVQTQRDLITQAEDTLEEYRDKLQKVQHVRQELRSHLQNLPDLTKLPSVTGGLAPLPSAGDLFNIHA